MSRSLRTGLSPFDLAQGDPEALEGSKDERLGSWFDKLTTSGMSLYIARTSLAPDS